MICLTVLTTANNLNFHSFRLNRRELDLSSVTFSWNSAVWRWVKIKTSKEFSSNVTIDPASFQRFVGSWSKSFSKDSLVHMLLAWFLRISLNQLHSQSPISTFKEWMKSISRLIRYNNILIISIAIENSLEQLVIWYLLQNNFSLWRFSTHFPTKNASETLVDKFQK